MTPVIQTEELTHRFGRQEAVKSLTLEIPPGSIFAFLGPNGAGKTTTIRMLMDILRPTSGSARVFGVESTRLTPVERARIGYVSENQKMPEWMTVAQLIHFCRPFYPAWDEDFAARLLKQFDLPLDRPLRQLSRGMKVKAALLVSLAYHPELLVLDEPFTGLDPLVRDEFIRGVLELSEQESWTVFLSSHDIDEVERLADHVGILNSGRLELSEPVGTLQGRFRQIECTVSTAPSMPAAPPAGWLRTEISGHAVRVVDSDYREGASEQRIRAVWPDAGSIRANPMSLRSIFLELANQFRFSK